MYEQWVNEISALLKATGEESLPDFSTNEYEWSYEDGHSPEEVVANGIPTHIADAVALGHARP